MNLTLVIERGDDEEIAGSVDTADFFFTTVGATEAEIIRHMRSQISDFLTNEGKDLPQWQNVKPEDIAFTIEYDLTALFEIFNAIKINSIAELAGINKGLMRQYASGVKRASSTQAKKVETAIRQLGERLTKVTVA
jgi:hypothetical protein